jgi:hypothetical protein
MVLIISILFIKHCQSFISIKYFVFKESFYKELFKENNSEKYYRIFYLYRFKQNYG